MPARATAHRRFEKTVAEGKNFKVDCRAALDDGESLTGTVTSASSPTGLTFASVQVNSGSLTILGNSVPAGKAIQGKITGGTADVHYTLVLSVATDSTPAQAIEVWCDGIEVIAALP